MADLLTQLEKKTKTYSIRIPAELHKEWMQLKADAKEAGYEVNMNDVLLRELRKKLKAVAKQLDEKKMSRSKREKERVEHSSQVTQSVWSKQ